MTRLRKSLNEMARGTAKRWLVPWPFWILVAWAIRVYVERQILRDASVLEVLTRIGPVTSSEIFQALAGRMRVPALDLTLHSCEQQGFVTRLQDRAGGSEDLYAATRLGQKTAETIVSLLRERA